MCAFLKSAQQELLSLQGEGGSENSRPMSHSSYTDDEQALQPTLQRSVALQTPVASLQPAQRAHLISFADILNDDLDFGDTDYYATRSVLQCFHCAMNNELPRTRASKVPMLCLSSLAV
jgi:hypothetical protein